MVAARMEEPAEVDEPVAVQVQRLHGRAPLGREPEDGRELADPDEVIPPAIPARPSETWFAVHHEIGAELLSIRRADWVAWLRSAGGDSMPIRRRLAASSIRSTALSGSSRPET